MIGERQSLQRSIAHALVVAIAFWIALRFLWITRAFLLILFLGVILGVTLSAGAAWLQRFRIRRSVATILIVVLALGVAGIVAWQLAPAFLGQASQIQQRIPDAVERINDFLRNRTLAGMTITPKHLDSRRYVQKLFAGQSDRMFRFLFPFLTNSILAMAGAVVVLFVAIYVSVEPDVYRRGIAELTPPRRRASVEELLPHLGAIIRRWLLARLFAMATIGLLTTLALWLDGVPGFAALGIIAGVLEFIPIFGPILAGVPATAMGLLVSPGKALSVVLIFIVINQIEGHLVTPLIMRSRISVPPLVTIAAVTMLGITFGVVGMIISEPVAALTIALTRFAVEESRGSD